MQEIYRKTIKYFIVVVFISTVLIFFDVVAGEKNLINLLPKDKELGKNVTAEYQQKAEGEKLVELINGGAVQFFKHGFEKTVFQEYFIDSTRYINLDIYKMHNSEGAKGIFQARTDTTAKKILVGLLGFRDDYYCTFYRDNYYVIVTGSDSSKVIQQILLKVAKSVDEKILTINKI